MRGESFSSLLSDVYCFFFSLLSDVLPPPPPCLSVACTGGPLGSSSQPVSWSPPPEQHMIFHDYCYCLCPSSRRLQARCAVDVWQKERRKLCKDKQEWAESLAAFP